MDLTTKENLDRLRSSIWDWRRPNARPRRKVGQLQGESMAQRWSRALEDMGSRGSGRSGCPFDTTASNTAAEKRGQCPHRQKMGKTCCNFAGRHQILELVVHAGVRPCLGCSSSPEHLPLQTLPKPHGRASTERTRHTGTHVEESGECSRGRQDEALRWTLQVLQVKSVRPLRR
ncbi:hypothetical protein GWK47_036381 [Chionoecetes opilio]|uniref:Uncharacterized protein n=1 Tax=Chionoecetes opilio TaxID=41210 RepID=A0A8J5CZ13_CHIOP|nr:hypothetical protein GWK47_036381 [Chionoecetes opilio]